jgi:DNA-binding response OmpR family regulator
MNGKYIPVILIVDDERNLRKLLQATLGYKGYKLYEASNGFEAIRLAVEHKPDVILLDIMMPGGIDGIEVCKRIKSTPMLSNAYIILLTALGQKRDRKVGLEAHADVYMAKPFSPIQLISVIEDHLSEITVRGNHELS